MEKTKRMTKEIEKLTPEQRAEGFKKDYAELVKKWGIDLQPQIKPTLGMVDTVKPKEDDGNKE